MKILQIEHIRDNVVIWQQHNLRNILHLLGEQFILSVLFNGMTIPTQWYLGLDNRTTPAASDTITSLVGEPATNGYARQTVPVDSFVVSLSDTAYVATSPIISFSATGAAWGPVSNLFLTTATGSTGVLVSTAALGQSITVNAGDSVRMRMAFQLSDNTPS